MNKPLTFGFAALVGAGLVGGIVSGVAISNSSPSLPPAHSAVLAQRTDDAWTTTTATAGNTAVTGSVTTTTSARATTTTTSAPGTTTTSSPRVTPTTTMPNAQTTTAPTPPPPSTTTTTMALAYCAGSLAADQAAPPPPLGIAGSGAGFAVFCHDSAGYFGYSWTSPYAGPTWYVVPSSYASVWTTPQEIRW